MSLGIVIKAPEGIVLAAESRVTLSSPTSKGKLITVSFDNATKLLTFNKPYDNIGIITYGQAGIGIRTAQTFIPEFETLLQSNGKEELTIIEFAKEFSDFFSEQWDKGMPKNYKGPDITFNVAGFNKGEPYGRVYNIDIPSKPEPDERNFENDMHSFGITWGGQREIVDRLVLGYDPSLLDYAAREGIIDKEGFEKLKPHLNQIQLQMPIQFMPLQDCINLATLFIETTIKTQNLTVGVRGCGGEIDVAIITRNKPLEFVKKKEIRA